MYKRHIGDMSNEIKEYIFMDCCITKVLKIFRFFELGERRPNHAGDVGRDNRSKRKCMETIIEAY